MWDSVVHEGDGWVDVVYYLDMKKKSLIGSAHEFTVKIEKYWRIKMQNIKLDVRLFEGQTNKDNN